MPLKIDLDIAAECASFNLPPAIVQSIRQAEGGKLQKAIKSIPAHDEDEAVLITIRSVVHAQADFCKLHDEEFVKFMGARWAPLSAKNDPKGLNKNWIRNVLTFWRTK